MTAPRAHREGFGHVAGLGARSVTAVGLLAATLVTMWRLERFRVDYWAQLSPWVTFLAGGFAVLAGTLVFVYWRLAERSHSYLRFGEKLPFGDETALIAARRRSLVIGRAAFVDVVDLPPRAMHALYVAIVLGIALIGLDNRAVALLHEAPARFGRSSIDYCKPPEPPKRETPRSQGCRLVERAYKQTHDCVQLIRADRLYGLSFAMIARTVEEHLAIIRACRARDPAAAEAALEAHFAKAMQRAMAM